MYLIPSHKARAIITASIPLKISLMFVTSIEVVNYLFTKESYKSFISIIASENREFILCSTIKLIKDKVLIPLTGALVK